MPITQQRLLVTITAGEHFQDTIQTLRASFNLKCRLIASGQLTMAQAFNQLTDEFNTTVPADSVATGILMAERVRFNITHKRNAIEKRRIYNKRHPSSHEPQQPPEPSQPPTDQILAHRLPALPANSPTNRAASLAARIDADDEAFQGLADLADYHQPITTHPTSHPTSQQPPHPHQPLPTAAELDPATDPTQHDPAYLAWKASRKEPI